MRGAAADRRADHARAGGACPGARRPVPARPLPSLPPPGPGVRRLPPAGGGWEGGCGAAAWWC